MTVIPDEITNVGEAIRFLRTQKRITLRGLARTIGVSAPFMSDVEHGRRHPSRLPEIADALGVDVSELEALDGRLPRDLKEWIAENPKLVSLLRDIKDGRRSCLCCLRIGAKGRP